MLIAQISDSHIALDTPDAAQRLRDLEAVVADLNALDPQPDLIVHTGDIVHNGLPEEYARAAAVLARARAPLYVIPGNKDDRANLRAAFPGHAYLAGSPDFIAYSVEDHAVRLVMLDTLSRTSNLGEFCEARARQLETLIGSGDDRPVAVFLHHPPFEVTVGPDRLHYASRDSLDRLSRALQRSGRVVAVFTGHVHRFAEGHVGAIPAKVVTALSTTLRKGDYPPEMAGRPVYFLHRIDAQGAATTTTRIAGTAPMPA